MARQRKAPAGAFVPGKPPDGIGETRQFGAVLCFRAMCCDFCSRAPYASCKHYEEMREQVNAQSSVIQCPQYRSAARKRQQANDEGW
jgi:hypothetical protein